MKSFFPMIISAALAFGVSGCGSNTAQAPTSSGTETVEAEQAETEVSETEPAAETGFEETEGKTLVVVFSATGTTKAVAEKIVSITGAELYEIKAAQEYTDADLDWHNNSSRTTNEQNDTTVRPEIAGDPVSLEGYSTIYIGYPIWWGEEPRIMDTFAEMYDFTGITMIPFCTSGSSGIGRSGKNIAENAGSGTWLDGRRFGAGASEEEIRSWIEELN